jgi:hypothetical protein
MRNSPGNHFYALLEIPEPEGQAAFAKIKEFPDGTQDVIKFTNDVTACMQDKRTASNVIS